MMMLTRKNKKLKKNKTENVMKRLKRNKKSNLPLILLEHILTQFEFE